MLQASVIYYLNEIGNRSNLEDAIFPPPGEATFKDHLFLVCDGVGGQQKGEEASRIVSTSLGRYLQYKSRVSRQDVLDGLQLARKEMASYIMQNGNAERMSTTLTLCALNEDNALIAWSGDSRVMHVRNGDILYQTADHSLVMELVKKNEITEEEAANHPQRNMILRSVNAEQNFQEPDFYTLQNFQNGDWLLLCTDGILENLGKVEIKRIFTALADAGKVPDDLNQLCMGNTKDNFSMYALKLSIVQKPAAMSAGPVKSSHKKIIYSGILLATAIFLLLAIAGFFFIKSQNVSKHADNINPVKATPEPSDRLPIIVPPSFTGGDMAWSKYCKRNINYPKNALKNRIDGLAEVRFLVDTNGNAIQMESISHLGHGLEKELKRVIAKTSWIPGTFDTENRIDTMVKRWKFVLPKNSKINNNIIN